MVAAIKAAEQHHKVTILEQRKDLGHKILATGNGRCNLTNSDLSLCHYHGLTDEKLSQKLVSAVLSRFSYEDTIAFFDQLGIMIKNKGGYIYPLSEQSSAVRDVLGMRLQELQVSIINEQIVHEVSYKNQFYIRTDSNTFAADRLIIATGSRASIPGKAATGYELASQLGHMVKEPLPALVQLTSDAAVFKPLAGIRTQGKVTLYDDKHQVLACDTGELQLTAYGISGIPVFQVSYIAARELQNRNKVWAELDFMPELDVEKLVEILNVRRRQLASRSVEDYLVGMMNNTLGVNLIGHTNIMSTNKVSDLTNQEIRHLAANIKSFRVPVKGTKSYADAQICTGGVPVTEVDNNLESIKIPGLYFCGEILDVNGDCGGYNLQWAWSSGAVAGEMRHD